MDNVTITVSEAFLRSLEEKLRKDAQSMIAGCEGYVIATGSGGLNFRLLREGAKTFCSYLDLFDEVSTPPVAICWPMRVAGGLAIDNRQRAYLAIHVRMPIGMRYGVIDPGKALRWLTPNDPRVDSINRCLREFRPEGGVL